MVHESQVEIKSQKAYKSDCISNFPKNRQIMFSTRIILLEGEVDCEFKAFQGNMFMDRLAALMGLAQHGNIHRVSQNAQNSTKMQTITVFLMVPHTYMLTSCKSFCNTM